MPSHPFNARRLQELEELLEIEYEKSHELEKEIALSDGASRITLVQRLKRDVRPRLRRLEEEYAEVLTTGVAVSQMSEAEADVLVVELSEATGAILEKMERAPSNVPSEMVRLLGEIQAKLSESREKETASAKLKFSLPLIPTICSYEMEIETAGLMKKVWSKTRDFFKRLVLISSQTNTSERGEMKPAAEPTKITQISQDNSHSIIGIQNNHFS